MVTPIRCPIITDPDYRLADPADFAPLLAGLGAAGEFPRGTVQPDGRLDLCKQGVGPALTADIARAVGAAANIRHLLLGTNALGDEGAGALASVLAGGHHLQTVYLGCNKIGVTGVAALAALLEQDDTVQALWLKRNPVGDEGLDLLAQALVTNRRLRTLDLVNTGVTDSGLARLADVLTARPTRLERLFLGGNGLTPSAVPILLRLVRQAGVHELYLAANHLGDAGVSALAAGCAGLPMTLGLGGNGLTPAGARVVAESMRSWQALDLARPPSQRVLGAMANVVGDTGAAELAVHLPQSRLRKLDLRHTAITGRGLSLLLAAAQDHPTLTYLGVKGGVPRRMRRAATAMLGGQRDVHPDVRAIASVYR